MVNKKQIWKKLARKCSLCDEENNILYDIHRLIPGCDGGKYTKENTIVCCVTCHRKIHNNLIIIKGKYNSTCGPVIIYEENGQEKISKIYK